MKNNVTARLAQGSITIIGDKGSFDISYQDHPDRNGQLLADLNHIHLNPAQTIDLNRQLKEAEVKLAQERARYANMASMDTVMIEAFGHLLVPSEDNNKPNNLTEYLPS